jgi:hypothetical protein
MPKYISTAILTDLDDDAFESLLTTLDLIVIFQPAWTAEILS